MHAHAHMRLYRHTYIHTCTHACIHEWTIYTCIHTQDVVPDSLSHGSVTRPLWTCRIKPSVGLGRVEELVKCLERNPETTHSHSPESHSLSLYRGCRSGLEPRTARLPARGTQSPLQLSTRDCASGENEGRGRVQRGNTASALSGGSSFRVLERVQPKDAFFLFFCYFCFFGKLRIWSQPLSFWLTTYLSSTPTT